MAWKVLIPQDIAACGKKYLQEHGCEIIPGSGTTERILCRDVAECDAVIARTAWYTRNVIDAGKKLKVISRCGIGVDNIDCAYAGRKGIWVTNGPRSNSNSVAEHTLYLILACAKNASYVEREFRSGNYEIRNRITGLELKGKTLGLIGLGQIGRMVAEKAIEGFGMRVIAYDPYVEPGRLENGVEALENDDEVYEKSDFVSLHLPATAETRQSIGAVQFQKMKPTAFFINAARGEIVVEQELIEALRSRKIRGAGLDVYETEPVDPDNPLMRMENVTLTPHYAAMTEDALEHMSITAARDVVAVLNGERPRFPVKHPETGLQ